MFGNTRAWRAGRGSQPCGGGWSCSWPAEQEMDPRRRRVYRPPARVQEVLGGGCWQPHAPLSGGCTRRRLPTRWAGATWVLVRHRPPSVLVYLWGPEPTERLARLVLFSLPLTRTPAPHEMNPTSTWPQGWGAFSSQWSADEGRQAGVGTRSSISHTGTSSSLHWGRG